MNQEWYPLAERRLITTNEKTAPRGIDIMAVVEHVTDGNDSRHHGQNVANNSSFTFLIGIYSGVLKVYQFMPLSWAAWGNGRYSNDNPFMPSWVKGLIARGINPNLFTVSIEHERVWPYSTVWDERIILATLDLNKWIAEQCPRVLPDRNHYLGHYQIDNVDRPFCPGGPGGLLFPFDRIVRAVQTVHPVPAPLPPPIPTARILNGHLVSGKFLRYWEENGSLAIFGFPTEGEVDGKVGSWGGRVQYFERGRMELHHELEGQPILLGHVGNEAKLARSKGCI